MVRRQTDRVDNRRMFLGLVLVALVTIGAMTSGASAAPDPAGPSLFVDAAWLKANQTRVNLVDARSEKEFRKAHIPGALSAPWQAFTRMDGKPGQPGWGTLLPAAELAVKIGKLGLDGAKPVVVYADPPGWGEDGRFAWMLAMLGVSEVSIVDGGFRAWKQAAGEITGKAGETTPRDPIVPQWHGDLDATTDWIRSRLGHLKIVDSRGSREFNGATPYGEARAGHLPGAISLPFETLFNADGTIKSREDLEQRFRAAGLTPDDEIVIYCTAGIRSAHMTLVMRSLGFATVRNYDASFYEWAAMKQLPLQ